MSLKEAILLVKKEIEEKGYPLKEPIFERKLRYNLYTILFNYIETSFDEILLVLKEESKKKKRYFNEYEYSPSYKACKCLSIKSTDHSEFGDPNVYIVMDKRKKAYEITLNKDKCKQELSEIQDYDIETFLAIHYLFEGLPIDRSEYITNFISKSMRLI